MMMFLVWLSINKFACQYDLIPFYTTMSQSKGYQRFNNRLDYFLTDCETSEAFYINKEEIKGNGSYIFKGVSKPKFNKLANRSNTEGSRKIVVSHIRSTILISFIKELYEEVSEYLRYILSQGAKNGVDSLRLVGDLKLSFKANEILEKNTYDEIIEMIISSIFQSLENERSTIGLLAKVNNKLDLGVNENLINEALPYLELRHVFVHSDGKPNKDFMSKYPFFKKNKKGRVEIDLILVRTAFDKVNALLYAYDQSMINKHLIEAAELFLTPTISD